MKLVKMSLAAAVLLGASAFAVDNVKVSGDAKVFYTTTDAETLVSSVYGTDNSLFDKDASAADAALRLSVTADLAKGISMGATGYMISTLGLENNLVSNTWTGAHDLQTGTGNPFLSPLGGVQVDDQAWMGELWAAATLGHTTAKVGRMELDTPLAFSEKWSIVPNTFDAAVIINQDLPDTTLVAAWVGKGNGVNTVGGLGLAIDNSTLIGDNVVGAGADFNTFLSDGAYAFALVNNSFKPLVFQAWYYDVQNIADAFWLQGDVAMQGFTVGAQYGSIDTKGAAAGFADSSAYAIKLGYAMDALKLSAAYSDADDDGVVKVANVATNNLGSAQSKLYTEATWNFGYVGQGGAEAFNVAAEFDAGMATLAAQYTDVSNDVTDVDMSEIAVSAATAFGPLGAKLAYIYTDADDQNAGDSSNTLNVYLTLGF